MLFLWNKKISPVRNVEKMVLEFPRLNIHNKTKLRVSSNRGMSNKNQPSFQLGARKCKRAVPISSRLNITGYTNTQSSVRQHNGIFSEIQSRTVVSVFTDVCTTLNN